jgi:hypothetical protein
MKKGFCDVCGSAVEVLDNHHLGIYFHNGRMDVEMRLDLKLNGLEDTDLCKLCFDWLIQQGLNVHLGKLPDRNDPRTPDPFHNGKRRGK